MGKSLVGLAGLVSTARTKRMTKKPGRAQGFRGMAGQGCRRDDVSKILGLESEHSSEDR